MTQTATCPLCGASSKPALADRPDREYGVPERLAYHRCESADCGLVFASPIPVDRIASFYAAYSTHAAPSDVAHAGALSRLGARLAPPSIRRDHLNYLGDWLGPDASLRVLDFGCGNARLLHRLRDRGLRDLVGFDFDPKARAAARGDGFEIVDTLDALRPPARPFDVIVLNHVVEHLDDPVATLTGLLGLLRPEGLLYLRTPNVSSALARLFGDDWRGWETPRHLHLFDVRSARRLAERLPGASVSVRTEHGLFQGMYHESFVAPLWRTLPGRLGRHLLYPIAAWACVAWDGIAGDLGEEVVLEIRRGRTGDRPA